MSFLSSLVNKAKGAAKVVVNDASKVYDQVNPFDNGLSIQTRQVNPNVQPQSVIQQAVHNPIVQGTIAAPNYFFQADIANPTRELAAQLTHNPIAYHNALIRSNQQLGLGANGKNIGGGLRKLAGNSAQLAVTAAAPEVGGAIDRSFMSVAPKVLPKIVPRAVGAAGTGAVVGAPYNVTATIADPNTPLTAHNLIQSAKQGAQYGAALSGGGVLAGAAARPVANAALNAADRAKFNALEKTGQRYNGLKPQQIIMNPNHLQALDDFQTSMRDGVAPPVKDQQRIVNALHEIKQNNGLDFLSGSPDARAQRIEQYQQQWHEGIKRYQNKLVDQQAKPSVLADENGSINNRGASNIPQIKKQLAQVSSAMKAAQGTPSWNKYAQQADKLAGQLEEARFNQAHATQPKKSLFKPLDEVGGGAIGDSPIRKALQGEKKQLPGQGKVVQNRLTKGGVEGRQNISPEVQAQISGEHAVRNTQALQDEAIAQANKLPLDKHIQAAHEALAVPAGKIDDKTVALAQQAIERADAAGRHEDAVGIHDALSEHLVKQGQTIQAASLLYRLSPQGQLYKALKDLKKGGATVTPEMEDKLRGLNDAMRAAKGQDAKEQAAAEFHKFVADNLPQHASNQLLSVWKAGLLSGVKTQAGNFASNATFGVLHGISNLPATAVDKGLSLVTGQRTKTLTGGGYASGAVQGARRGLGTMKTGIDARNIGAGKYEVHGELNFKNSIANNLIAKPTNFVFRGMSAADQPFYYAALKNNLIDMAKADGMNKGLKGADLQTHIQDTIANPPAHIAEQAKLAAQKSVLAQDSKIASSVSQFAQNHPVAQLLVPFVKVPTNFLTRTLDYTPVGVVKEVTKQIRAGKLDQRALSEAIGEATTGSALIYLGAELANHNLLSGQYPQNDQKEQQRWKTDKIQPNSVKIGKTWINLNYLGPAGLLLGAGKDYHDAAAKGDDGTVASIAGFGKNLTGQSFLTGFSGFSNAINDPQRSAKSFINSQVASVVPSISNDAANLLDKNQRQANTPLQQAQSRIPLARNNLPVKQDVYGNPLTQRTGALNLLANPLKPSDQTNNAVTSEVDRLHAIDPNNKDLQVTPTPVQKKLTIDGTPVSLNDKQVYNLQHQVGQATQSAWSKLIATPEYQKLSDVDKANALNKARQGAAELAQRQYVTQNNLGTYSKQASSAARKVANGDLTQFAKAKGASSSTTKPDFNKSNDTEYKYLQAQYNDNLKNNKFTTDAAKIKAQTALDKAKVGASYSNQVRSLYGLTKSQAYTYLINDPNGSEKANQLVAYGDALVNAGLASYNKFRNSSTGNVSIAPAAKKTSSGTTTRKTSSGLKTSSSKGTKKTYTSDLKGAIATTKNLSSKLKAKPLTTKKLSLAKPKQQTYTLKKKASIA